MALQGQPSRDNERVPRITHQALLRLNVVVGLDIDSLDLGMDYECFCSFPSFFLLIDLLALTVLLSALI